MPCNRFKFIAVVMLGTLGTAQAATYSISMALNPAQSGLTGSIELSGQTGGSMTGDFDAAANPAGTRTKPGLLGSFGAMENVPVAVHLTPSLSGDLASRPQGQLMLNVDTMTRRMILSGLDVDLLPGGPASIPSEIGLSFESFRTRMPDALYIGGFPVSLPLGDGRLTALRASQFGSAAGELSEAAEGRYDFNLSTVLLLTGSFEGVFGAFELPPVPVSYALAGQLEMLDGTATLLASAAFGFSDDFPLGLDLPEIPFGLPTILPPGGTANMLFDLALESLQAEQATTLTLAATGPAIPEPACALVVTGMAWIFNRRRRVGGR